MTRVLKNAAKIKCQSHAQAILRDLKNGEWKHRREIVNTKVWTWTAAPLQRLLISGLVERENLNLKDHNARYRITKVGLLALKAMQRVQPFNDTPERRPEDEYAYDLPYIVHEGYKYAWIPVEINEFWKLHFQDKVW